MSDEMYDASDVTWPPVSGKIVDSVTLFVPRPWWQQRLAWLVPKWRWPRQFRQSALFNQMKDAVVNSEVDWSQTTIKVVLHDNGTFEL